MMDTRPTQSTRGGVSVAGADSRSDTRASLIASFVGRWWALHTRSRNEKAVARQLEQSGIQHFLPLARQRRRYGASVRQVSIPLFPGYVFLCGQDADRIAALKTKRVAKVLEVPDQSQLVRDLLQIEQVLESPNPIELYPRLRVGTRCRVASGPLAGLEGVVLRRQGPWRLFIGVQFIGQSAELEVDPTMLDVLD